jgi:hypothetical protein
MRDHSNIMGIEAPSAAAHAIMDAMESPETLRQLLAAHTASELDLSGMTITKQEASRLAEALSHAPHITHLRMERCGLNHGALLPFINQPTITGLALQDNKITAKTASYIATHNTSLQALDIGYNPIGDEGVTALAAHPALQRLDVTATGMEAAGLRAVLHNPSIRDLSIGFDRLAPEALAPLAQATHLQSLRVTGSIANAETAKYLLAPPNLCALDVACSALGDTGAAILAADTTLTALDATMCGMGDAGATALNNGLRNNKNLMACHFDGISPALVEHVQRNREEAQQWLEVLKDPQSIVNETHREQLSPRRNAIRMLAQQKSPACAANVQAKLDSLFPPSSEIAPDGSDHRRMQPPPATDKTR